MISTFAESMSKKLFLAFLCVPLLIAALPSPKPIGPMLVGRAVLSEGLATVNDPRIRAGTLCIFSVVSPDSLSEDARVSVATLDNGILQFWSHDHNDNQTDDEPEVNFSLWNSTGPNTYP